MLMRNTTMRLARNTFEVVKRPVRRMVRSIRQHLFSFLLARLGDLRVNLFRNYKHGDKALLFQ